MSSGTSNTTTPPGETMTRQKGSGRTGLYVAVAVIVVIIIIVAAGYAAGWFKTSGNGAKANCSLPSSVPLTGAGSTLVAPLMLTWAAAYTQSSVSYSAIGSGGGITDITQKTVDFGASDAPMNPSQSAAVPSPGVLTIPESAGAVVPIYNLPSVSVHLKFTGQLLAAIYLGKVTTWNDPSIAAANPGVTLPSAAIQVVHRSDGSGTSFVFTSFLSASNATWKTTIGYATSVNWPTGIGAKGNSGVTNTVLTTQDAIGYVDINYALTNAVSYGSVANPSGNYVLANITNIASAIKDSNVQLPAGSDYKDWYNVSVLNAPGAGDYPVATLTYLFVYSDVGSAYGSSYTQAHAENLVDFLHWIITNGQSASAGLYYVPLPAAIVSASNTTLNSIQFNGASIPVCVPSTPG